MPSVCLGIVAHVDAGKTSLTERLLYDAGVVDSLGRVDHGTTRTDSMALERRRGITIKASVTAFDADGATVTIVDTPGHPDFIAEVGRSLSVLDAALLVVSAVEGVQPQTIVLWRALERLGVPTVVVINKIDRRGADVAAAADQVRRRLTTRAVTLTEVTGQGTADADVRDVPVSSAAVVEEVAAVDDRVLDAWASDRRLDDRELESRLWEAARASLLVPVVHTSALTGSGAGRLAGLLPRLADCQRDVSGELSAQVFAVDRDGGRRATWVRVWDGSVAVRQHLSSGTVTSIEVATADGLVSAPCATAGQVARVHGPSAAIGDVLGRPRTGRDVSFPPAALQATVAPVDACQRAALFTALTELADEDPWVELQIDESLGDITVRLRGEVQRDVIEAVLTERFGVEARFGDVSAACVERVAGRGCARELLGEGANPYLASLGLTVEAGRRGEGVTFDAGIEPGRLPPAFVAATEEGVRAALRHGLAGWPVTDAAVRMTASQYYPRQSRPHQGFDKSMSTVAADFRNLGQVVTMAALRRAGTHVCLPVDRVDIEVPGNDVSGVLGLLGHCGGQVVDTEVHDDRMLLTAHVRSALVPSLSRRLPDATGGEALLVSDLDHFAPVAGLRPCRPRPRPDPLDREAYFRDVPR